MAHLSLLIRTRNRIEKRLRWFRQDLGGNIALIFGLVLPVVMIMVGGVIDYSYALNGRDRLSTFADAAALASVSEGMIESDLSWEQQKVVSKKLAEDTFSERLLASELSENFTINTVKATPMVSAGEMAMEVCFEAEYPTNFLGLIGLNDMPISDCVVASYTPPQYAHVIFLVDASGSMGIGASAADQQIMLNKMGCAFACHTVNWQNPSCTGAGNSRVPACAARWGAKTRFEVVKQAMSEIVQLSSEMGKKANQFKFSVYKFSNFVTEVHPGSTEPTAIKNAISHMTMDAVGAGSNISYAMDQIRDSLPASGDAKSPNSRKVFLILVTDGVEGNVFEYAAADGKTYGSWYKDPKFEVGEPGFWAGNERSQALQTTKCGLIKDTGITIGILNVEYMTPVGTTDYRFQKIKELLQPTIRSTLASCASSASYFYRATDPADILNAGESLFKTIISQVRLSA